VNHVGHRPSAELEAVLRKRFRALADEYELLVQGGAGAVEGQDADQMRRELDDLADAINRVGDGSYGVCGQCGQGIPAAVLAAVPTITLCAGCSI
jgi:RNA polymerase-binding transcription factor DksA